MKLVAWNLGHQTIERRIESQFLEAVRRLAPDLLILNEYVHGPSRAPIVKELANLGLRYVLVSDRVAKHNQVLIASRYQISPGDLRGPVSSNGAAQSNFLHVVIPSLDLEVVGLRAPMYSGAELDAYWHGLLAVVRPTKRRRIIYLGDLNSDPESTRPTAAHLRLLTDEGWLIPKSRGDWSFCAGTRIDHAIASPCLNVMASEYVVSIDELVLASEDRYARVSDHAALVVQLAAEVSSV